MELKPKLEDLIQQSGVAGMKWDESKKHHQAEVANLMKQYGLSQIDAENLQNVVETNHLTPQQVKAIVNFTKTLKKKPSNHHATKGKTHHKSTNVDVKKVSGLMKQYGISKTHAKSLQKLIDTKHLNPKQAKEIVNFTKAVSKITPSSLTKSKSNSDGLQNISKVIAYYKKTGKLPASLHL
jgi:hypothetical protein